MLYNEIVDPVINKKSYIINEIILYLSIHSKK